jgi:hypothetical protein
MRVMDSVRGGTTVEGKEPCAGGEVQPRHGSVHSIKDGARARLRSTRWRTTDMVESCR